jgi:hypothetical protein
MRNYRADVVGSLLRPGSLLAARSRRDSGQITSAEFKRIEDRSVDMAIGLQELAGVDVVTDGEMRRLWFTGALSEAIDGIEELDAVAETTWHGEGREANAVLAARCHRKADLPPLPCERGVHVRSKPRAKASKSHLTEPDVAGGVLVAAVFNRGIRGRHEHACGRGRAPAKRDFRVGKLGLFLEAVGKILAE